MSVRPAIGVRIYIDERIAVNNVNTVNFFRQWLPVSNQYVVNIVYLSGPACVDNARGTA
jgi:hypothetical protein